MFLKILVVFLLVCFFVPFVLPFAGISAALEDEEKKNQSKTHDDLSGYEENELEDDDDNFEDDKED